jgi:hypothetical protein
MEAPITPMAAAARRSAFRAWAVAVTAGSVVAAGLAVATPATASQAASSGSHKTWVLKLATQYFPPTNRSQFTNVLVEGRTSWFFGGSNFVGRGVPEIEQRKGGRWHSATLPSGLHSWITEASATSPDDIWAVTYLDGRVLTWNGSSWTIRPKGGWSDRAQFTGIEAVSPRNVWLFGATGVHPGAGTWHLSGTKWTRVRGTAADIYRASAVSPTDMWAFGGIGGTNNALLQFRGSTWHHVQPPALAGFKYSLVLAFGPRDVWVAGTVKRTPELGRYNGHKWVSLSMPGSVAATGMCGADHGAIWVIANSGVGPSSVLNRSASGIWTSVRVGSTPASQVLACAQLPGTTAAWGAGIAPAPSGSAAAVYAYGNVP